MAFVVPALFLSAGLVMAAPTDDDSGNGFTLTEAGGVQSGSDCYFSKYGRGYAFDGRAGGDNDDRLTNTAAGTIGANNMALTVAVELDELPSVAGHFQRLVTEDRSGQVGFNLRLTPSDKVAYFHLDDEGVTEVTSTFVLPSPGAYTFTLRRVDIGGGNMDLRVRVNDGDGFTDAIPSTTIDQPNLSSTETTINIGQVGETPAGSVCEVRLWKGAGTPAQATLESIADPQDAAFTEAAQGGEHALWFMGDALPQWTEQRSDGPNTGSGFGSFYAGTAAFANDAAIFIETNKGDLIRCVEQSCVVQATDNFGEFLNGFEVVQVPGTDTAIACWRGTATQDSLTANVDFSFTTNSGQSWVSPSLITTTTTADGVTCALDSSPDGGTYVATYHDGPGTVSASVSSDGGASWTDVTDIATDTAAPGSATIDAFPSVAVKNATHWVVAYVQSGPNVRACRTTDAGTSWSCTTIQTTANGARVFYDAVEDKYVMAFASGGGGGGDARFATSATGALWTVSTIRSGGGGIYGADIVRAGDEYFAAYLSGKVNDGKGFCRSSDLGITWSCVSVDVGEDIDAGSAQNRVDISHNPSTGITYVGSAFRDAGFNYELHTAETIAPETFGANVTVAVANLRGIGVSPIGNSLIVRTGDSPDTIRRFDAQSLTETNSVATSSASCNRLHGVSASTTHLAYLDCVGSPVEEYVIRIRSLDLTTPTFPSGCTWCNEDFVIASDSSGADNFDWDGQAAGFAADFAAFDTNQIINFKTPKFFVDNAPPDGDYGWMTWNFNTADGRVGHAMFTAVKNANEVAQHRNLAMTQHGSSVQDICGASFGTVTNPADVSGIKEYLGAVESGGSTVIYEITYSQTEAFDIGSGGFRILDGNINQFFTNPSMNNAEGIDCTNHAVVVANNDPSVVGRNYTTPVDSLFDEPIVAAQRLGVAVSGDGKFVAYATSATSAEVARMSDGFVVATLTPPAGAWHSIHTDFVGSNVWIATDSNIARYEVAAFTCEPNCDVQQGDGFDDPAEEQPGGVTPGGDPIDTVFGGAAGKLAEAFGFDPNTSTGATAGSVILALLLISMLVALGIVGAVNLGGGIIMPVGGGILGFAGTWAMGLIPHVVAFVVLAIALALLSMRWFVR